MGKILDNLMDWRAIEDICYGESDNPHEILGAHRVKNGTLIQAYFPDADDVIIEFDTEAKPVKMVSQEQDFFAAFISKNTKFEKYHYVVEYDKKREVVDDAYNFQPQIQIEELDKFNHGIHYNSYDILGARQWEIDGIEGVLFTVWAPNALAVSVVGDFNHWLDKANPMRRLWDSGVFELFVPGLGEGCIYKFSILYKDGNRILKSDPYGFMTENKNEKASIVTDIDKYKWNDNKWLDVRKKYNIKSEPMSIYEVHLSTFDTDCKDYEELAEKIADHVSECGYTHVLLMPIMEYVETDNGYRTFSNYAPCINYGKPRDFQKFIDYFHSKNIGVLLEVSFFGFPLYESGLSQFDGTWLYEHMDRRQGYHPLFDMAIYNYARPQVTDFLISNAFFWAEKYHIDGLFVHRVDSVLYLDYSKSEGQWLPNIYGGNENLDGIEFFKHLNSVFKKKYPDVVLIAEDNSGWPLVTEDVKKGGLGFDLKLNFGWSRETFTFMGTDPLFRSGLYNTLSNSMLYQYSEDFVLPVSHKSTLSAFGCIKNLLPGSDKVQYANIKAWYAYMYTHPGKKLLFMGQDIGYDKEWDYSTPLSQSEFEEERYEDMRAFIQKLNELYRSNKALYESDSEEDSFMWLNAMNSEENILTFIRSDISGNEKMLVVANFVPVVHESHLIGVPFAGKYKEIFNTDDISFGGEGIINPRVKTSKVEPADGFENSIKIKIAPMSVAVFKYVKAK